MKVIVLINLSIGLTEEKYTGTDDIKLLVETSMNALPAVGGYLIVPPKFDLEEFDSFGWTRDEGNGFHLQVTRIDSKMVKPGQFMPVIEINHVIDTWNVWVNFATQLPHISCKKTFQAAFLHPEQFGINIGYTRKFYDIPLDEFKEGDIFYDAISNTIYDDNL